MLSSNSIKKIARQTITTEARAVTKLLKFIDNEFARAISLIYKSKGRLIITGIGKSAIIGNKIVATLNSTGTPAIFMHAADAIHGDLGIIQEDDIVLCISKSGNSPEIKLLVPLIKNLGNSIIGMVSNNSSFLAQKSDITIITPVDKEACPNNLAPTSSTTVQLVTGDAIAVCLLECRGFTEKDYARYHPGGTIGKKLYMRVSDFFLENKIPRVYITDTIPHVIFEISSKRLGATAVLNDKGELAGIITDGDLRRMLEKNNGLNSLRAGDIMTRSPRTIDIDAMAIEAFEIMKQNNITQLLIMNKNIYSGIIHLHDILKEGVV
ncbi:MAG: SIS domain-containing protein [Bacteroidales bacterium]